MSIKDIDRGYKKLLRDAKVGKTDITVGIHAAEGQKTYQKGSGQSATLVDIATFNEFGMGVPERSFVRGWFDKNKPAIQTFVIAQMRLVVAGKITKEQALDRIGLMMQTGMQANISNFPANGFDKNADSTIARKGSSVPLIDTGQLRSSISYRIDN